MRILTVHGLYIFLAIMYKQGVQLKKDTIVILETISFTVKFKGRSLPYFPPVFRIRIEKSVFSRLGNYLDENDRDS